MLTENEQAAVEAFLGSEEEVQQEEMVVEEPEPTSEEPVEEEVAEPVETDDESAKSVPLKAVIEERKKRQELEAQLKKIQEGQEEIRKAITPPPEPKDVYEAFDWDPDGIIREINVRIERLADDDAYGNAKDIEKLRDLKDNLRRYEVQKLSSQLSQQTSASQTVAKITEAIPDFATVKDELTRFAVEELGYTDEDLVHATNLSRGDAAVREVLRIHKMYQRTKATPQKKEARPRPIQVETAGKGIQKQEVNIASLRAKAMKTGKADDWAAVLDAIG